MINDINGDGFPIDVQLIVYGIQCLGTDVHQIIFPCSFLYKFSFFCSCFRMYYLLDNKECIYPVTCPSSDITKDEYFLYLQINFQGIFRNLVIFVFSISNNYG